MCEILTGKKPKKVNNFFEPYQIKKEDNYESKLIEIYKNAFQILTKDLISKK